MAIVVMGHNITRVEPFNGTAPGNVTSNPGGGPAATENAGLQYEGAQSLARRINATGADHGFIYVHTTTFDLLGAGNTVTLFKSYTVLTDINSHRARIGSAATAYFEWMLKDDGSLGDDAFYLSPALGGYIILPIEVRKTAWMTEPETGSPNITVNDAWGVIYNVGTTTGAGLSSSMDAIDITDDGLFLTRGDGADPDGVFQDFVDADEGAGLAGAERSGMFQVRDGVIFCFAKHTIGRTDAGSTANPTVFNDSNKTIVFPGGYVSEGFNGFELDITNASSDITWTGINVTGLGRSRLKRYFDTNRDVNATTDRIEILNHGFSTGDQVIYSAEGGVDDIGPDATTGEAPDVTSGGRQTGNRWYVHVFDENNIQLHPTMGDGLRDTTQQALTVATAPGENHSLERSPDTRPDIDCTGAGGSALFDACIFTSLRNLILTSGATVEDSQVITSQHLEVDGGQFNRNVINQPTVNLGEAFCDLVTSADLANMDDNIWISGGEGHAIRVTTTGTTVGWVGNTFSGYGPGSADDTGVHDNQFDTITGVDAVADTITISGDPFVTGDPVYYSDEGGTDTIGLTDNALYYVRRTAANTYSVHTTAHSAIDNTDVINLNDGATGEGHVLYSANAAFWNDSGGTITLQVSGGGQAPSIRNTSGSTTIVENNISLTLSGLRDNTEVRICDFATNVELAGVENATDGTSDDRSVTFSLAASTLVHIRFAHGIAADGNRYLVPDRNSITPFTWPTTTTTLPITQIIDRNFNDPA